MIGINRRRQGYTDEDIRELPDRRAGNPAPQHAERETRLTGDPLLDGRGTREYLGRISEMTHWRWRRDLNFPDPDVMISRRNFRRLSTIERWLEAQSAARNVEAA
jgi:hypothetical protein